VDDDEYAEPLPWYSRLRAVAAQTPQVNTGIPFTIPPTRDL